MSTLWANYMEILDLTIGFGEILTPLLILSSFSLIFFSLKKSKSEIPLYIHASLFLLGFIFLAFFHYKISQLIIKNPYSDFYFRFKIPLWIENEKLYFWCFIAVLLSIPIKREEKIAASIPIAIFTLIVCIYSNPFLEPLPNFSKELYGWVIQSSHAAYYDYQTIFYAYSRLYSKAIYYYNSSYMWIHPPLLFASYGSLFLNFSMSGLVLIKDKGDQTAISYAKFGYFLLTIGLLIGYPWAIEAWKDEKWWFSPKINASIMLWLFYTGYLHLRLTNRNKKIIAGVAIFCYISLIFTFLISYYVKGVHTYA